MADSKISALPASTVPLAGTEVLPIVQSSATKQVSVANLTAGRAVATGALTVTGDATLSTGNLIPGTAAKGVNFTANTPAAGMTSQLLNWYEEGTWTPEVSFAVNTGVTIFAPQTNAKYTRIGRQVHVQGRVTMSSIGVAVGTMYLATLPFAAGSGFESVSVLLITVDGVTFNGTLAQGTAYCDTSATALNFTNTSIVRFSLTYSV